MQNKISYFLFTAALAFIVAACEYDRIEVIDDCGDKALSISIDASNSLLNLDCGASNGAIVLQNDSDQEILYSFNNGDFIAASTFSNLSAGTYEVVAKVEGTNCLSNILNIAIINENGLQIALAEKVDAGCGIATGSITISQNNGALPIQYKLAQGTPQENNVFDNLQPGTYDIIATDANGCEATLSNINITTGVSLEGDIQSIINTNCAVTGCHSGSQPPNLSSLEGIISNASRIKSRTSSGTMPPSGRQKLTQLEIDLIACWVDDGAENN